MSVGSIRWKNYSAVPMHRIFGRRYKSGIRNSDGKGLNWKGWKKDYCKEKNNYFRINEPEKVIKGLQSVATSDKFKHVNYVVIDTVNNLMVSEEMRRCREKGYDKWMDLAQYIWNLVELPGMYREDLTVILVFHTQTEHTEDGIQCEAFV